MGVDLGPLAESRVMQWPELRGKVIAVDAYNTLYQFLSSIRGPDGSLLSDSKGRVTSHLTGLFYRSVKWLEAGIKPVFVFDGKPPELKKKTLEERKERKEKASEALKEALAEGKIEQARVYAQATSKLTQEMADQARQLLFALGIPSIQAPSEGEAQAAELVRSLKAWAAASQDYDSLLFGCPRLVRNLSTSGKRKLPNKSEYVEIEPELLELDNILSKYSISRKQLVWLAMLVGTDYNEGVKGIGPKKALKLVQGANSFNEIVSSLNDSSGLENWEQIEQFFLNPPVEHFEAFSFNKVDKQAVISLLCDEFDFSHDRVERTLDGLILHQKETGSQTRLGDW
jgi:flap endonuclease-1